MNNWKENINTVKEIFPGHFQIILDFATSGFVKYALRDDYNYVWVIGHQTPNSHEWTSNELPVFAQGENINVLSRKTGFDYVLPTHQFKTFLANLDTGIELVQLNKLPSYYVDPQKMKGRTFFDILKKECDYLFYLDIPAATDYGTLVSSSHEFLQGLLYNPEIDWTNLP